MNLSEKLASVDDETESNGELSEIPGSAQPTRTATKPRNRRKGN